jgi:ribose 5-phosphate isomerase B
MDPRLTKAGLKVALAADHAGFELKEALRRELEGTSHEIVDLGAHSYDPRDDYPDFAERVAREFAASRIDRAVVVCGSGVGVCVALNKFAGIRAAICHDGYSARQGVEHDSMNVLCLGSRIVGVELAKVLVHLFLDAEFTGEDRHVRRLEKVVAIERRHVKG